MFTEKFTALDNDFITVWSNFLYGKDMDAIDKQLTTLAEMGQVDAMAKFYKFHNVGENPTIDNLADSIRITNMTAKECKVKASKAYAQHKVSLGNLIAKYIISCDKYGASSTYAIFNNPNIDSANVKEALKDNPYVMFSQKAIRMAFEEAHEDRCIQEDATEWAREFPDILRFDTTVKKEIETLLNQNDNLRLSLKNSVTHINTEALGDEEFIKNTLRNPNSVVAFAYAKNLTMNENTTRNQILGRKILFDLKSRPLSQELVSRLNSKYPEDFAENTTPDKEKYEARDNFVDYAKLSEEKTNSDDKPKYKSVMNIKEM